MGSIPPNFIKEFANRNGVLFIGRGVAEGSGIPAQDKLKTRLLDELEECDAHEPFEDIAQYYCDDYGLNALITTLRDAYETHRVTPSTVYEAITEFPV